MCWLQLDRLLLNVTLETPGCTQICQKVWLCSTIEPQFRRILSWVFAPAKKIRMWNQRVIMTKQGPWRLRYESWLLLEFSIIVLVSNITCFFRYIHSFPSCVLYTLSHDIFCGLHDSWQNEDELIALKMVADAEHAVRRESTGCCGFSSFPPPSLSPRMGGCVTCDMFHAQNGSLTHFRCAFEAVNCQK